VRAADVTITRVDPPGLPLGGDIRFSHQR
jgi:hypothetical protein